MEDLQEEIQELEDLREVIDEMKSTLDQILESLINKQLLFTDE